MIEDSYIVKNKRGDLLVAFHRCAEESIPTALAPITHSLVVATHDSKTLLMLNTWKNLWELPGGIKEPNESLRECALREFSEETNQEVSDLAFLGIMELRLQPNERKEFGALFRGFIAGPQPFVGDGEAQKILFWDHSSDIGEIDAIDKELVTY